MGITLGPFDFAQFEVPEKVRFGGRQSLAIHKLPGGSRIVDAMGRDDSEINWNGTFSGSAASSRARQLDALRVAGSSLALNWDAFCYSVVISRLDLDFRNAWWIPFKITCVVITDGSSSPIIFPVDLSASVLSDLSVVSGFFGVSAAISALSAPGALSTGTQQNASALSAVSAASAGLSTSLAASEVALSAAVPTNLAGSAQTLAQLCCAQGYLSRAGSNITETDS